MEMLSAIDRINNDNKNRLENWVAGKPISTVNSLSIASGVEHAI